MASPGYRRCPQDTAYPQDTDSILSDTAVSSGYRRRPAIQVASACQWGILRIPCPQDAPRAPGARTPNRVYRCAPYLQTAPLYKLSVTVCRPRNM
eukprot:scaffold79698_cov44-Phaeocystis_antarctica.AAC.1